jgi:hypothetical protein
MSWINKLFGGGNNSGAEMNEDRFWELLAASKGSESRLKALLTKESTKNIVTFTHTFDQKHCSLNRWDVWGAGYVIAGGMGDDSFHYFKSWILGKGKECYDTAMTNPDSLAKFVEDPDECDNELLEYVMVELLEQRGIEDLRSGNTDNAPAGTQWEEGDLEKLFPQLWKQYGE